MPRSALEVAGWHGNVMAGGGDRFDTAECELSLHTVPIGQSVPLSEHDVHQTHYSTYPTSTQLPFRMSERFPEYARIGANRETSVCDESSRQELSLQMGGKGVGANVHVPHDLRGNVAPHAGPLAPASSELSKRAANTTQLSSRDSSGGKVPHVHAVYTANNDDVSLPDGARSYTHYGEGANHSYSRLPGTHLRIHSLYADWKACPHPTCNMNIHQSRISCGLFPLRALLLLLERQLSCIQCLVPALSLHASVMSLVRRPNVYSIHRQSILSQLIKLTGDCLSMMMCTYQLITAPSRCTCRLLILLLCIHRGSRHLPLAVTVYQGVV